MQGHHRADEKVRHAQLQRVEPGITDQHALRKHRRRQVNSHASADKARYIEPLVHTGALVHLSASPRVSVKWLSDHARLAAGLKEEAQTGAYEDLKLRWVLVDAKAEGEWKALSRRQQQQVQAMLMPEAGLSVSRSSDDRMSDLGIYPGIVFHLVAVPDEAAPLPRFRAPERVSRFRRRVL